jgi:hypothetical protein
MPVVLEFNPWYFLTCELLLHLHQFEQRPMAEEYGFEHRVVRDFVCARLDHNDVFSRANDHQVKVGYLHLAVRGVND